jgi:hypothetical protein
LGGLFINLFECLPTFRAYKKLYAKLAKYVVSEGAVEKFIKGFDHFPEGRHALIKAAKLKLHLPAEVYLLSECLLIKTK